MMKKKGVLFGSISFLTASLAACILLGSCADFFTTSWFSWAVRDPYKIIPTVTLDNIDELILIFEDSPEGSFALLRKIDEAKYDMENEEELNQLRAAALEAAVNASGLGQSVLTVAGNMDSLNNVDASDTQELLKDAVQGMNNIIAISDILTNMLPSPGPSYLPPSSVLYDRDNLDPEFLRFADEADANDLAMAAIVIILGEAAKYNDIIDFLENGRSGSSYDASLDKMDLTQAMAIVIVLTDRVDELGGPLRMVLENLNMLVGY